MRELKISAKWKALAQTKKLTKVPMTTMTQNIEKVSSHSIYLIVFLFLPSH